MKTKDKSGYYNAVDENGFSTDPIMGGNGSDTTPSDSSLNAPTANQGFNTAKAQGWLGSFTDFLNHFNNKNAGTGSTSGGSILDTIGGLFGKKPAAATPAPAVKANTTYFGMSAPVAIIVITSVVVLVGFGVYKAVKK